MRTGALVLSRPIRRFTALWCLLVLVSTHPVVAWLSLCVVLAHLVRAAIRVLRFTLLSGKWFSILEEGVRKHLDQIVAQLERVTPDSAPTPDLKNLWSQTVGLQTAAKFLRNEMALSRWGAVVCGAALASAYFYFAILFSVAYYGVARVTTVSQSWGYFLLTSLFIPFQRTDLPKTIPFKLLGGIHCALLASVGVGIVLRYCRRYLDSLRSVATIVSIRLAEEPVKQKYSLLAEKFANGDPLKPSPAPVVGPPEAKPQIGKEGLGTMSETK